MNEQLAIMPAQMALRCISQGLRGGLPVVLGLTAITIGGTVFGAVQGVKACKRALEKPKAGENSGKKILDSIRKQKGGKNSPEGQVYAFEIKEECYKAFAKEAKDLGIAYAATKHDGVVHLITDHKNERVVEMLSRASAGLAADAAPKVGDAESEAAQDAAAKDGDAKEAAASSEAPEPPYKEVPFRESLWSKIISFAQNKILAPFKGANNEVAIPGLEVSEDNELADDAAVMSFDGKDKGTKDLIASSINETLTPFRGVFNKDSLAEYENAVERGLSKQANNSVLPILNESHASVSALASIRQDFESSLAPVSDRDVMPNEIKNAADTVYVSVADYPEVSEMVKAFVKPYFIELGKLPGMTELSAAVTDINETLQYEGFKGNLSLDSNGDIELRFDPADKNDVLAFSKDMNDKIAQSSFRDVEELDIQDPDIEVDVNLDQLSQPQSPLLPSSPSPQQQQQAPPPLLPQGRGLLSDAPGQAAKAPVLPAPVR